MSEDRFDQRLQLVVSHEFIEKVDDWRRRQEKIPNRSEAIRRLVDAGLKALSARARAR